MTSKTQVQRAFEFIQSLIMEDGDRWGDIATEWQIDDVLEILGGEMPWHFITRPRGASKTTDLAAVVLAYLVEILGVSEKGYGVARDNKQARLLVDEIEGFVRRTPKLGEFVTVHLNAVTNVETNARFEAVEADPASVHGLRGRLFVADELARWPETDGARAVWTGFVGSARKRLHEGSKMVVITAASTLSHWSYGVLQSARADTELWRTNEVPGPTPWMSTRGLDSTRRDLGDAEYERQIENRWTELDTVAVSRDAVEACRREAGTLEPQPGRFYVHGVDLSMTNDYTVVATCHYENRNGAEMVILDRIRVWKPTKREPIDWDEVRDYVLTTAQRYRGKVSIDMYQAAGIHRALQKQGVAITEKAEMTAGANNKRALALNRLLQDRRLEIPGDDPELVDELASLAFKETTPGVYRMETTRSGLGHHDRASAISFTVLELLERGVGPSLVFFDDDLVRDPLNDPATLAEQYGPIAAPPGALHPMMGIEGGLDIDESVIGGVDSPYAVPGVPADGQPWAGGVPNPFLPPGGTA